MKRLGFVPMSAKPFHAGHAALISIASQENDHVTVYVSLSDRDFITGETMGHIWKEFIESILPANVTVIYGGSPVRNVYVALGEIEKEYISSGEMTQCSIYSDVVDIEKNYTTKHLVKSAPTLSGDGLIKKRGVSRTSTIDTSGTAMREAIVNNDYVNFALRMPLALPIKRIFKLLRNDYLKSVN